MSTYSPPLPQEGRDIADSLSGSPITTHAPKEHLRWIDVCKGIGIVCVVIGHTLNESFTQHFVYLFHMPLFFFLSGYLHKPQPDLKKYAKKKAIHLLVPYLAFLLLFAPFEYKDALHHGISRAEFLLHMLWGGSKLKGACGVVWFVTCLYLTQQLGNAVLTHLKKGTAAVLGIVSLAASYLLSLFLPHFELPWNAHVVLAALPFFFAGYFYKQIAARTAVLHVLSWLGAICAVALVWRGIHIWYDMREAQYGVPVVTFLLSLCCILTILPVSKLIASIGFVAVPLTSMGALSMGIMYIHKGVRGPHIIATHVPQFGWHATVELLLISWLLSYVLFRVRITRAILFGSERDLSSLFSKSSKSLPTTREAA